jgi:hypothetical protein
MTENTRIYNRFSYHLEDIDCHDCLHYIRKGKNDKTACGEDICRFEDIRQDAIKNGRIKRPKGWFNLCRV